AINRYSATTAPRLDLWWLGNSQLQYQTSTGSLVEPASSPNVLSVGAVCWSTGALEPYSSQGSTVDGRMKPELVGPDSVTSDVYGTFTGCGTSGFSGTSAAAPHVAGAAALLAQQNQGASASQLETLLLHHVANPGAPTAAVGPGGLTAGTLEPRIGTVRAASTGGRRTGPAFRGSRSVWRRSSRRGRGQRLPLLPSHTSPAASSATTSTRSTTTAPALPRT